MWLDRADETFNALLWLPWINSEDQYMFYITVTHLLPESRVAIRHNQNEAKPGQKTQGFKILVAQKGVNWVVEAILLSAENF